jgi:hypothetical protein
MWLNEVPQFTCNATKCGQVFSSNQSSWRCDDIACKCNMGTKMCGGGTIDLSATVDSANDGVTMDCGMGADCTLNCIRN